MAYLLDFDERALKEWRKLGSTVREQFKKKLSVAARFIARQRIQRRDTSRHYKYMKHVKGFILSPW